MVAININELPKEVRDMIELKEQTDLTFSRFVDEDYTDIFWNMLAERADPGIEHSFIASIYGLQGGGKCLHESTWVNTPQGLSKINVIKAGEAVISENGSEVIVSQVHNSTKKCLHLSFDFVPDVIASLNHYFPVRRNGSKLLLKSQYLQVGDLVPVTTRSLSKEGYKSEYHRAVLFGAYLADGSIVDRKSSKWVQISNNDRKYLTILAELAKEEFGFKYVKVRNASGEGRFVLLLSGEEPTRLFSNECGRLANKRVPAEVFQSRDGMRGLLDGYSSSDMTCNVWKQSNGKQRTELGYLVKSEALAYGLLEAIHTEGFWPIVKTRTLKSGIWKGNKYVRIQFPAKDSTNYLLRRSIHNASKRLRVDNLISLRELKQDKNKIVTTDKHIECIDGKFYSRITSIKKAGLQKCVDIEVDSKSKLFSLAGGLVTHNSMSAIAIACFLDPTFNIDRIYFSYNDLVYDRNKLQPNTTVLVDEQSQSYGLDSHRVMIILANLKEQLRKKSIHFLFCSPVLYEEHKSSMYLIEMMFIDYKNQEAYAALKTREGLTLGHIRVPYPLKVLEDGRPLATKELIAAYQQKKDVQLEKVLGRQGVDIYEERAKQIMKHPTFKKAEELYVRKMGYIPQATLINIINRIFPEFNAGVVPAEIAGRIKLDKELSGVWEISGRGNKTKEEDAKKARSRQAAAKRNNGKA